MTTRKWKKTLVISCVTLLVLAVLMLVVPKIYNYFLPTLQYRFDDFSAYEPECNRNGCVFVNTEAPFIFMTVINLIVLVFGLGLVVSIITSVAVLLLRKMRGEYIVE